MSDPPSDYYALLGVSQKAAGAQLRRAFRKKLLEVHPDKTGNSAESSLLAQVILAFETLSDPNARERYDRARQLRLKVDARVSGSSLPHVTESSRPRNRARAILFLLLQRRAADAVARLRALPGGAAAYLARYLEVSEFVDAAFLIGEYFEKKRMHLRALDWYQEILRRERRRKFRRPCYEETCERAKRILIQKMAADAEPRSAITYLARAEALGLTRAEIADVSKRRAQCYLALGMRWEAARNLKKAITLQPQIKGIQRLQGVLQAYL